MSFTRYIKKKLSITKCCLPNVLPTAHLPNTKRFKRSFRHHRLYKPEQLPPKVDLRPNMTPIDNQLNIGSSVANCLAGAYEYLTKKSNGCNTNISRLFIYYNARVIGNYSTTISDTGCSMTCAIEALEEFGTCLESVWPYDISRVDIQPDDEAYEQAENHKINEALHVNIDLNEMKSCLAQGFPFAFGLKLYSSFDNAAKNGIVSIPNKLEQNQKSDRSHALLAVGYSDRSNAFIVRNSWGEDWGDKGYCYIPYDYLTNSDFCFDVWTIRKVLNDDFDREYWHFDDIVNYLNDDCIDNTDEEYLNDNDRQIDWEAYYNRTNITNILWNEYRDYRDDSSRYTDDYFNDRYRRDRYDLENDPYEQHCRGYINNGFSLNKTFPSPLFDRYEDEDNYSTMPLKTYLVNKIQDQKFRLNGIYRSQRLPNKNNLCQAFREHVLYSPEELPPKVDLRPDMTPVEDQSQIGSCTANSLAGAYEYLNKKAHGTNVDVSRLFIYYNSRVKANYSSTISDTGCSMTDTIEALEEFGTCLESLWPYDSSRVNTKPNDNVYQQASSHKISQALQVNIDLNEMKSCLAQGFPFAFGLSLYTSFDKAAKTGVVPMPDSSDASRESDGNHALLAVGYSDESQAFIVRNSWGEDWGEKGYCYIPYDYLTNTDYAFDAWTVRKIANDDFGKQNWHFRDVINYLHQNPNRFSDDNNDNDDDDNHAVVAVDENDDDNGDVSYNTNDNTSWSDNNNYEQNTNDYSTTDDYSYNNQNEYNQDNQFDDTGFNSNTDFSYPDEQRNYRGYSDFN
ncbi:unnamed protein product [Adineta steineri]|uniref:Peptidase C1A papain C-terminal domain-containing protein n=1 Tax=Adineta steineri TaxID=433720 RepID=A0A819VB15_9BILA|nr:unnamed protein product [Adineta steineri]